MMVFAFFLLYVGCFAALWMASGLVITPIVRLARSLRIPRFLLSFFLLGMLTSLPEMTIGALSIVDDTPGIFVGTMLGGVIVLLLGIVPILGIIGNGVKIPRRMDTAHLILLLTVVIAPALFVIDQRLALWEGVALLCLYGALVFALSAQKFRAEKEVKPMIVANWSITKYFIQIVVGMGILYGASRLIIAITLYLSQYFSIPPFFIGLVVVALGTNIPELSIVFRSVFSKKKDLALGDYLGSAAANTFLLGIFILLYGKPILLPNHVLQRLFFLSIGLLLFFFFARSRHLLSRKESFILLACYIITILFEVFFLG